MSDETWRPLGIDADEQIAAYDALHDDVPPWMESAFWAWVRGQLTVLRRIDNPYATHTAEMLDTSLAEAMCQQLKIALVDLRAPYADRGIGKEQLTKVEAALRQHPQPLQIADYLLAHGNKPGSAETLEDTLTRSKSAWQVGTRHGRPGLVRRVPRGVQESADSVMARAGRAGVRLSRAWEELYGIEPNPSAAYALAIKAVEDAAVPVVSPANARATLGTVLSQMDSQADWRLPMAKEDTRAPSIAVVVGMMRLLWHGQHDRHGGQPSAPGDVSLDEATVAVSIAVALVNLFHAGLVAR